MPSKAQKQRGALLPAILPEDTVCVQFQCPDNEFIIAALKAQLADLGKFLHWERGGGNDRRATDLAARWRELIEETFTLEDCATMLNCDDVKACLDDQEPPPRKTPPKQMEGDLLQYLNITDCGSADKDKIYGYVTQFVDFIDTVIVDIFQVIEAATNSIELLSAILDAFSPFSNVFNAALDAAEFIQDTFAELYYAGVTLEVKSQIACDLFCIAVQRDCVLTLNDINIYFADQLQTEITSDDINDYISYFIGLDTQLPAKIFALAAFALVSHTLAWGGEVIGIGNAARLIALTAAMSNDPNSDWVVLCDECEQFWCYKWDFTDGTLHDWTRRINSALPDGGTHIGQGIRSARQTINTRQSVWIESHTGELTGINTLEIQYSSPYPLFVLEFKKVDDNTTHVFADWPAGSNVVKIITSEFLSGWDDAQLYLYSPLGKTPSSVFHIEAITVKGFGTLPAGLTGGTEC